MNYNMPGFPVLHYLLQFGQTHVRWVSDATYHLILCHPFSYCPQPFPVPGCFPMSWLFSSGGQSTGASASAWEEFNTEWRQRQDQHHVKMEAETETAELQGNACQGLPAKQWKLGQGKEGFFSTSFRQNMAQSTRHFRRLVPQTVRG